MEEILKRYQTAEVREKIQANIRANRCGDFEIAILNGRGEPLACTEVKIRQIAHSFKFGANCFMVDELETEDKNAKYQESFAKVFNIATFPFYWNSLEPERGKPRFDKDSPRLYRRPAIDKLIDFCKENGIEPKGHCLNYEPFVPDWAKELEFSEYKAALELRMKVIAERYAEVIPDFEVMNEILQEKRWETPLRKDVQWSFTTARKYLKNNKLIINEGNNVWDQHMKGISPYYDLIEENLKNGVPIDGIGVQAHVMWSSKEGLNPYNLWSFFDKYANLGLPLSITEVTIPAAYGANYDEDLQAELLKCLYSLWFGVKGMEAIIYWNLIDGYAHGAPLGDMSAGENVHRGGLLRFDGSEKPAFKALDALVNHEWRTNLVCTTDSRGRIAFSGFFGDYEICFKEGDQTVKRTVSLSKSSTRVQIT